MEPITPATTHSTADKKNDASDVLAALDALVREGCNVSASPRQISFNPNGAAVIPKKRAEKNDASDVLAALDALVREGCNVSASPRQISFNPNGAAVIPKKRADDVVRERCNVSAIPPRQISSTTNDVCAKMELRGVSLARIKREHSNLSNDEKEKIEERFGDTSFLPQMKAFLDSHERFSPQSSQTVMRQIQKLAEGEGIRYDSSKHGWPKGCWFSKGVKITLCSDIVGLMENARDCERKWGRDRSKGWLLAIPLKKLLLFQQFVRDNPGLVIDNSTKATDAELSCEKDGKKYIGTRVGKLFDGAMYFGTVDNYSVDSALWHVVYDDGDDEEYDINDLETGIAEFRKWNLKSHTNRKSAPIELAPVVEMQPKHAEIAESKLETSEIGDDTLTYAEAEAVKSDALTKATVAADIVPSSEIIAPRQTNSIVQEVVVAMSAAVMTCLSLLQQQPQLATQVAAQATALPDIVKAAAVSETGGRRATNNDNKEEETDDNRKRKAHVVATPATATKITTDKKMKKREKLAKKKRRKGMRTRKEGTDGMLSTTHVMVAKGATSQITRCVIGKAVADLASKKGTMQKERAKEKTWQKRMSDTTQVSRSQPPVSNVATKYRPSPTSTVALATLRLYEPSLSSQVIVPQAYVNDATKAGNFRGGEFDGSQFEGKYVFMRGSKNHTPFLPRFLDVSNGKQKEACWIDVEDAFRIVDCTTGSTTNKKHFVMIPRDASIGERMTGGNVSMQQDLFEVFQKLELRSPPTDIRRNNISNRMMTDGENSNYIVIGTSPKRFGKGTQTCTKGLDCPDLELHRKIFGTWYRRVEHCAKKYLPFELQKLLAEVGEMCDHGTMPLGHDKNSEIWPALAVGRNVFLNVHKDADYFWTLITVVADEPPTQDGPIICYMCFPTLGTAVALRNGDLLMFNPLVPHCVSTRCDGTKEAYCISMYMKSLWVGGSDNSQQLSEQERDTARLVLENYTNKK